MYVSEDGGVGGRVIGRGGKVYFVPGLGVGPRGGGTVYT